MIQPTAPLSSALADCFPSLGQATPVTRLVALYRQPGPFASIYLATGRSTQKPTESLEDRWCQQKLELRAIGATPAMLDSADRLFEQERPPMTEGMCILVAADGFGLVEYDHLQPLHQGVQVSPLPSVSQLLEWRQRRVPTLLISAAGDDRVAVVNFSSSGENHQYVLTDRPGRMLVLMSKLAIGVDAQLVIVAGRGRMADALASGLPQRLPVEVRVVTEPEADSVEQLASATLRHIGVHSAGLTLRYLREHRFLATVGGAVEGPAATLSSLTTGAADAILVHDERGDRRTVWAGKLPRQLSLDKSDIHHTEIRLIDGVLRSAILQSLDIRVTPSLGPVGPVDHIAAITFGRDADRSSIF